MTKNAALLELLLNSRSTNRLLHILIQNQEKQMAAIDTMTTAVTAAGQNASDAATLATDVLAAVQALHNAGGGTGTSDAVLQPLADALTTANTSVAASLVAARAALS